MLVMALASHAQRAGRTTTSPPFNLVYKVRP
jgi:hypothetical protein